MPEVKDAVESKDGDFSFVLQHPIFKACIIRFPSDSMGVSNPEFFVPARSFYKLLLAMLTKTSGWDMAFHLPGGFGEVAHQQSLNQVEQTIEELMRILEELKESTESENSLVSQTIRRKLQKGGA